MLMHILNRTKFPLSSRINKDGIQVDVSMAKVAVVDKKTKTSLEERQGYLTIGRNIMILLIDITGCWSPFQGHFSRSVGGFQTYQVKKIEFNSVLLCCYVISGTWHSPIDFWLIYGQFLRSGSALLSKGPFHQVNFCTGTSKGSLASHFHEMSPLFLSGHLSHREFSFYFQLYFCTLEPPQTISTTQISRNHHNTQLCCRTCH